MKLNVGRNSLNNQAGKDACYDNVILFQMSVDLHNEFN